MAIWIGNARLRGISWHIMVEGVDDALINSLIDAVHFDDLVLEEN